MRNLVEVIGANGTYVAVDPRAVMRIYHESGNADGGGGSGCRILLESGTALFIELPGHEVYKSLFGKDNGEASATEETETGNAVATSFGTRAYDEILRLLVESPDDSAGELATAILSIVRSIINRQRRGNFHLTALDREYNFAIDRMLGRFARPAIPAAGSPR